MTVNRGDLDEGLQTWLAALTGKQIGLAVPPHWANPEAPEFPHGILYPFNSGPGEGSYADPEEDRWFTYQITSVGQDHRQCSWLSDHIRAYILGRAPGGGFQNAIDLSANGIYIQERASVQLGAILPSGEKLFTVQDTYMVKAGPA